MVTDAMTGEECNLDSFENTRDDGGTGFSERGIKLVFVNVREPGH